MKLMFSLLLVGAVLGARGAESQTHSPGEPDRASRDEVMNFAMLDHKGRLHELRRSTAQAVVLYFTANGCDSARQSYRKLQALRKQYSGENIDIWLVNSHAPDDRNAIDKEASDRGLRPLPVLKDDSQGVARLFDVTRSGEVIAVSAKDWKVFYRGAIDDQLVPGATKGKVAVPYLQKALDEFLAGKKISDPQTAADGCPLAWDVPNGDASRPISYVQEIAPLLEQKCVTCHSPGQIGPFAMSSYRKVKAMAETIREVVLARRMPPWDADPHYGKFANDRSLTTPERQRLLRWLEQGAPRGEGEDPLPKVVVPVVDWPLGEPDLIVRLPEPQQIPATGIVDYRHVDVPADFTNDVWAGAAIIRPGNLKAVHHVIVRIKYPKEGKTGTGETESLEGWSPGKTIYPFPKGTGKKLRPGAVFNFELHYNTTGKPETDRTELGVYFLKEPPPVSYKTLAPLDMDLNIPPGDVDARTSATVAIKRDTLLYSLIPHMHTRGSWMKYEALYPDGQREVILSVPRYDFNWQVDYRLAQPKLLKAGTWILCTGGFDNSGRNPHNANPEKRVHWGEQSFDEMFIGFMQVGEVPREPKLTAK